MGWCERGGMAWHAVQNSEVWHTAQRSRSTVASRPCVSSRQPRSWSLGSHLVWHSKQLSRGEQALIVDYDAERETYLVEPMRDVMSERKS